MDVFVQGQLNKFAKEFGFEGSQDKLFEKFSAWIYLQEFNKDNPEIINAVTSGGGDDEGVDVSAVVLNGKIITDPSEIEEASFPTGKNYLHLFLIQAKTSTSYDAKLISKFLHGVEKFADAISSKNFSQLEPAHEISVKCLLEILQRVQLEEFYVPAKLIYITTAAHSGKDAKADSQVQAALTRIKESGVFQPEVDLELHGKSDIQRIKESIQGPKHVTINFPRKTSIPAAEGIKQSYIGAISADQIVTLVSENNTLRDNIYDDNVRLYQGESNHVNSIIRNTLESNTRTKFPVLNNGVTIVAKSVEPRGDELRISNYQIVNGCQTSNEIFNWWKNLNASNSNTEENNKIAESIFIPIKLVETESDNILSEITIAANRQTPINEIDIVASNKIAKTVEEYFENTGKDGLRYMRQPVADIESDIPKLRIFDTQTLNRSVSACIFGDASTAAGSPKQLSKHNTYLWKDYPESIYFLSAKIIYQIDRYITNNSKNSIKASKWHIGLLTARILFPTLMNIAPIKQGSPFPASYKKVLDKIGKKVHNEEKWKNDLESSIGKAIQIVEEEFAEMLEEKNALVKDDVRSKAVQEKLIERLKSS